MIDKGEIKNEKEKRCNPCGCTYTHTYSIKENKKIPVYSQIELSR